MKKLIPISFLILPFLASAQGFQRTTFLLTDFRALVRMLLPVLIAIALAVFFWGIVQYLFTEAKEKGSKLMFWGIVALFVMVSVWGLVRFIQGELLPGIDLSAPPIQTLP